MQHIQKKTLTRNQFSTLRNAKKLIKDEFGQDIHLQDDNVLEQIYNFALESQGEELFELFTALNDELAAVSADSVDAAQAPVVSKNSSNKLQVGDVLDGKKVISIYRGKPVFSEQ